MGRVKIQGEMEIPKTLQHFARALKGPKPGLTAQLSMITYPRPGHKVYYEVQDSCLNAGVLILLYPWKDRLYLVLTQRTSRVDYHQSQISFPGGQQEKGESLDQTALREAYEELAVRPGSIRILGELTPLYVPPSNFCIYPIVATADKRPSFQPFAEEVAEVIEVPLDHLLDPKNIHKEVWTLGGTQLEVPFYLYRGHKIWGATAMVLAEFLELWQKSQA